MSLLVLSQSAECPVPCPAGPISGTDTKRVQTLHFRSLSVSEGVSLSLLLLTKNLQQLLEGLLLKESLESPISKMFPYGSPSASQERLTNVLSSLQIQF